MARIGPRCHHPLSRYLYRCSVAAPEEPPSCRQRTRLSCSQRSRRAATGAAARLVPAGKHRHRKAARTGPRRAAGGSHHRKSRQSLFPKSCRKRIYRQKTRPRSHRSCCRTNCRFCPACYCLRALECRGREVRRAPASAEASRHSWLVSPYWSQMSIWLGCTPSVGFTQASVRRRRVRRGAHRAMQTPPLTYRTEPQCAESDRYDPAVREPC